MPEEDLKVELAAAEQKINELETEVERLTDLMTGIPEVLGSPGVAPAGKSVIVVAAMIAGMMVS